MRMRFIALLLSAAAMMLLSSCEDLIKLMGVVADSYELEAEEVTISADKTQVSFSVFNGSTSGLSGIEILVVLTPDTSVDTDDYRVQLRRISVGESESSVFEFPVFELDLSGVPSGYYYVGIIVNPNGQFTETSQANNTAVSAVTLRIASGEVRPDPPAAPENLLVANPTESSLDISWDPVTNADYYELEWAFAADGPWSLVPGYPSLATSVTHDGLTAGALYYYRVKAANFDGEESYTAPISRSTLAPSSPVVDGILTLPEISDGSGVTVLLDTDSDPLNGFAVSTSGVAGASTTFTYSITGASAGTYFVYAHVDTNGSGGSADYGDFAGYFDSPDGTPPGSPSLSVPTSGTVNADFSVFLLSAPPVQAAASGFTIDASSSQIVTSTYLQYTDVDSIDADIIYTLDYIDTGIELRVDGLQVTEFGTFTQQDVNGNLLTIADLAGTGGTYSLDLSVEDELGNAADFSSVTLIFDVNPPLPTAPTVIGFSNVTSATIDLSWDSGQYANEWELERSFDGGLTWQPAYFGSNMVFPDVSLTANTEYTYRVRGVNTTGVSAWHVEPASITATDLDPSITSWGTATPIPTGTYDFGSESFNNELYVVGGIGAVSSLQVYDVVIDSWSAGAAIPFDFSSADTARVGDKIYAPGGGNSPHQLLQIYDITTDTWSQGADISPLVGGYGVRWNRTEAIGTNIYIIGGQYSGTSLRMYDTLFNTWSVKANIPISAGLGATTAVVDGQIYLFGRGNSNVLRYDPTADAWFTHYSDPALARYYQEAVSINGKIYIFGGASDGSTNPATVYTDVRIYDPSVNSIDATPPFFVNGRIYTWGAEYADGRYLVFGGRTPGTGTPMTSVELTP